MDLTQFWDLVIIWDQLDGSIHQAVFFWLVYASKVSVLTRVINAASVVLVGKTGT
jgi:hypothetical protein